MKHKIYIYLLLAICCFSLPIAAQNAKQTKPVMIVVGTYHMSNPGRDVFNRKADDVLAAARQKEIVEFVALIKKFKPTRIAVEKPIANAKLNERYVAYLNGKYELTADEVDQIGFRLGKEMNHKQVFTVDWQGNFDIDRVMKAAAMKASGGRVGARGIGPPAAVASGRRICWGLLILTPGVISCFRELSKS